MEKIMKKYLFAMAMLGLTSVASQAAPADACTDCTKFNTGYDECVNNYHISMEECAYFACPNYCQNPLTSKPKKM